MTKSSKQFLKCNYKFLLQKAGGKKKAMRTHRESAKSHHTLGREFCCHSLKQRAATWKCYRHFWNPLSSLHIICCYLWFSYFPVKSVLWTKGQIIKSFLASNSADCFLCPWGIPCFMPKISFRLSAVAKQKEWTKYPSNAWGLQRTGNPCLKVTAVPVL